MAEEKEVKKEVKLVNPKTDDLGKKNKELMNGKSDIEEKTIEIVKANNKRVFKKIKIKRIKDSTGKVIITKSYIVGTGLRKM